MHTFFIKSKNTKSALIYLSSFLLSTLIMALILLGNRIYPGSERTMLVTDMKAQLMPFLASLRYIGQGDNSLFFNWSRTMGGNFLGLFAYYLASPLSWITLFFDLEHMPEAIYVLSLLKIGLCGLTFSIFLNKAVAKIQNRPVIVVFSCCYALMSYNMLYLPCIMWTDGVILLPLVLLGIERILQGKRGGLYFLSITMCFISNYYISYIVGLFSAIYLLYRLFCSWSKERRRETLSVLLRFGINTLLGIGISMPLLLPALQDLTTGRILSGQGEMNKTFYFSFFEIFTKMTSSQYDTIQNSGALPSLFCGTLMVLLALCFFFQKKHTRREKIGAGCVLVFLLLSFWIVALDKVWHCFQYPNWFPYRYAFVFSAMLLLVAYKALEEMDIRKISIGPLLYRIFCVFTLLELFLNGSNITGELDKECGYAMRFNYENMLLPTQKLVSEVKETDDGLYRMDKDYEFSINDSMLLNYNSLTHSSSTFNHMADEMFTHLGLARYHWWNMNYGSTLLTDSLFAVKYRMAEGYMTPEWNRLDKESWYTLYENPYALSMGYVVNQSDILKDMDWQINPFANQNLLLQRLADTDTEYFSQIPVTVSNSEDTLTVTLTAPSDCPLYLRAFGEKKKLTGEEEKSYNAMLDSLSEVDRVDELKKQICKVYVNEQSYGEYFDTGNSCNLYLGTFTPGEEVTVEFVHNGWIIPGECFAASLDTEALTATLTDMASGNLIVTEHQNGGLKGTVTAGDNQVLFTSIPYDRGFTVKVDNKEVSYTSFADTFLVIPIEAGTHTIQISYLSPGFVPGCIIAVIALLLLILYYAIAFKSNLL